MSKERNRSTFPVTTNIILKENPRRDSWKAFQTAEVIYGEILHRLLRNTNLMKIIEISETWKDLN